MGPAAPISSFRAGGAEQKQIMSWVHILKNKLKKKTKTSRKRERPYNKQVSRKKEGQEPPPAIRLAKVRRSLELRH